MNTMSTNEIDIDVKDWRCGGAISHSPNAFEQLFPALIKAQAMMGTASKDSTNPHFRSRYADLASVRDAVHEPFAKNCLGFTQIPTVAGDRVSVQTILFHESGEWMSSTLSLLIGDESPQAVGSAITYARRYSLMAIAGVAPEDDDGSAASHRLTETRAQRWEAAIERTDPKGCLGVAQGIKKDDQLDSEEKGRLYGLAMQKHAGVPEDMRTPEQKYKAAEDAIAHATSMEHLSALEKAVGEKWQGAGWTEGQRDNLRAAIAAKYEQLEVAV